MVDASASDDIARLVCTCISESSSVMVAVVCGLRNDLSRRISRPALTQRLFVVDARCSDVFSVETTAATCHPSLLHGVHVFCFTHLHEHVRYMFIDYLIVCSKAVLC